MQVSNSDIRRQLSLGEDSDWEFKEVMFSGNRPKTPKRDNLADELAAFANGEGCVMLLGVTAEGGVQGMSREQMDRLDKLVVDICRDAIKPPLRPYTARKEFESGKAFLLVRIREGDALHRSPGGCYSRSNGSTRELSRDEQLLLARWRAASWLPGFDKRAVPDTGFDTLDMELWRPLLSAEGGMDPQASLQKLHLLENHRAETPRATVAGILLCTRKPHEWLPHAAISAVSYMGPGRAAPLLDAREITGPLNRQIEEALLFVRRNMTVAARKTPARIDMPQYSLRAVFEAIVNAVAHRDYSMSGQKIRLAMFDDRLEISSPGELPRGITIDSMSESQATRNEALTSIFGRMPVNGAPGSQDRACFMERRGDGVRIILRETRELCGKDPEHEMVDGKELHLRIPAATHRHDPCTATIRVRSGSQPLPGMDLLVLYPSNTRQQATTGHDGAALVDLYTPELPMKVFVAAGEKAAHCERRWVPAEGVLEIELQSLPGGGSVIFSEGTGQIPGLDGSLSVKHDDRGRTHLYARTMAVNSRKPQPVNFLLDEELLLTDSFGEQARIRFVQFAGSAALVEYRRLSDA